MVAPKPEQYICRVCGTGISKDRFEYSEIGECDYWFCPACKFDRIGFYYLQRAGYDPYYIHSQLHGRAGYAGVNIDTYEKVLRGLAEIKLKRTEGPQ